MEKLNLVCVDDQRDVLAAVRKDLEPFAEFCRLVECESAAEARQVLEEIDAAGGHPALLICDHVMPGTNGIDFLIEINRQPRFSRTRKLLLTGLATHRDTIVAINQAGIDRYQEKPWKREELMQKVRVLLTEYVMSAGLDYQMYLPVLDQQTLYGILHART